MNDSATERSTGSSQTCWQRCDCDVLWLVVIIALITDSVLSKYNESVRSTGTQTSYQHSITAHPAESLSQLHSMLNRYEIFSNAQIKISTNDDNRATLQYLDAKSTHLPTLI